MRTTITAAAVVAAVLLAGCGRGGTEGRNLAEAYGYLDTVTTAGGPPPTQPPDPQSIAASYKTPEEGTASANGTPSAGVGFSSSPVVNTACVIVPKEGDTVASVVDRLVGVSQAELRDENGLGEQAALTPGEPIDICIGNDIYDIYGTSRIPPSGDYAKQLQTELNALLAKTSMLPLAVDGDAGKLTQQATCAVRALIGLPVSTGYPIAGSAESEAITAASKISVPAGAPTDADRWLLIDKTCQVMFAGERDVLIDVYPTSTGAPGYATGNGDAFEGYRFDPALATNGWHDSTAYPTAVDDPNNGNMYKPLYFNEGEAIHGAGYVPAEPRSKGCARTFPKHQDQIVKWLGLDDLDDATWKKSKINVRVMVRGRYLTPAGEPLPLPDVIIPPAYEQPSTTTSATEPERDSA